MLMGLGKISSSESVAGKLMIIAEGIICSFTPSFRMKICYVPDAVVQMRAVQSLALPGATELALYEGSQVSKHVL